jgi:predicted transcriptional regulator
MANAASKVRSIFKSADNALTLTDIRQALPELKSSQISMALCYLMRQRYMTRKQIKNEQSRGRKTVWLYTYYEQKLPKLTPSYDSSTN